MKSYFSTIFLFFFHLQVGEFKSETCLIGTKVSHYSCDDDYTTLVSKITLETLNLNINTPRAQFMFMTFWSVGTVPTLDFTLDTLLSLSVNDCPVRRFFGQWTLLSADGGRFTAAVEVEVKMHQHIHEARSGKPWKRDRIRLISLLRVCLWSHPHISTCGAALWQPSVAW